MQGRYVKFFQMVCGLLAVLAAAAIVQARVVVDTTGRKVTVPDQVDRVYCSGPGCLRLLTYLQGQDRAVAVDELERQEQSLEARPYALAHPQLRRLPLGGEFRGRDNPELLLSLSPSPEVIFKTFPRMGMDPETLQDKTGIPVVALNYGDLGAGRKRMFHSLRTMGKVLGRSQRARDVIQFFEQQIAELESRTESIPASEQPSVYVGGVAFKGPHGMQSTEPGYPPFSFVPAENLAGRASPAGPELRHSIVAKEQIMLWDPDVVFIDLATLQLGGKEGGLYQLRNDPAYRALSAVQGSRVYSLLPYNWYATNFGSVLANAYFIGSVLYPDRFSDLNVQARADTIFSFLVGSPVYKALDRELNGMVFDTVRVD